MTKRTFKLMKKKSFLSDLHYYYYIYELQWEKRFFFFKKEQWKFIRIHTTEEEAVKHIKEMQQGNEEQELVRYY